MIWLDAHLSPRVARWLREELGHEARHLREIALREADDNEIFVRAKQERVVMMSKDKDFADLVSRLGPPPAVIWLRCGNTSEDRLKQILSAHLHEALDFIAKGEPIVEIC